MISKYSPPNKIKCFDCGDFSIYVRKNSFYKVNLCVDCFLQRQIKNMNNNKK